MARDERPVLVLSELDDVTADGVTLELARRGVPVVRMDPGADFPADVSFTARIEQRGWAGALATTTRRLDLSAVRAVYRRRPTRHTPMPGLAPPTAEFAAREAREGLSGVLANLPGCLYVNHPDANRAAAVKVRQLALAAELGFCIPPSLVTNDPEAAQAFAEEHDQIIYKPLAFVRQISPDGPRTIWTQPVEAHEINESIAGTAHLFQRLVHKSADLRVTVVGDQVFCVRITADPPQLDWRRAYGRLTHTWCEPTDGLAEFTVRYLRHFGLAFGCFDFGVTEDGAAVFFECNPNGQWAWLEEATGAPITAAFAGLLEGGL
ncbi:ATP-grasp ribosomal peptide maturase [Actinomadura flavalba]|uniref:ATP-grasp ribosomal peptide maturase n=1 Tax=Actinomadura flavalba TaxID=1120938 RepID=UPI0003A6B136|nr:ATP-grasp ribosomal peptide maturase [Actinomadura flavalba]